MENELFKHVETKDNGVLFQYKKEVPVSVMAMMMADGSVTIDWDAVWKEQNNSDPTTRALARLILTARQYGAKQGSAMQPEKSSGDVGFLMNRS